MAPVPKSSQPRQLNGMIAVVVGPLRGDAQPEVPVQFRRDRLLVLRHRHDLRRLRPDRPVGPDVDLVDRPDGAGLDDLDRFAQAVLGRTLVAHLRGHLHLGGHVAHLAGLGDRVRQRLLAVNALALLHGHQAGRRVRVVGGADGDGVDLVAELVEHLAVVGELLRVRVAGRLFVEGLIVHVAKGDDLAVLGGAVHVAGAFAADADAGDVDFVVGGFALAAEGDAAGRPEAEAGDGGFLDELAAIGASTHGVSPVG